MIEKFPSVRYHRSLACVTVADETEHDALGDEWADTPAAFLEDDEDREQPAGRDEPEPDTDTDEIAPDVQVKALRVASRKRRKA